MTYKKKLIEVALPLDAINEGSAKEKEPFTRHHPRSMHVWWARRPLISSRAVMFAQIVDDPSAHPEQFPTVEEQARERTRLWELIERMSQWELNDDRDLWDAVRREVAAATGGAVSLLDPFAGGASIPIEAARLGLAVHAADLNPVAVLINKISVEFPAAAAGFPQLSRDMSAAGRLISSGRRGLAADVEAFGQELVERLAPMASRLYASPASGSNVIGWLWCRTTRCENPACGEQVPLISNFDLSRKEGRACHVEPYISSDGLAFRVKQGTAAEKGGNKEGRGSKFRCIACGLINDLKVHAVGLVDQRMMVVIEQWDRRRNYREATPEEEALAKGFESQRVAPPPVDVPMSDNPRWFSPPQYGLTNFADLFTARQLRFAESVGPALESLTERIRSLAEAQRASGTEATLQARVLATYLAAAMSRWLDLNNTLCSWNATNENVRALFSRQALPMTWDYVELNPLGPMGSPSGFLDSMAEHVERLPVSLGSSARQADAAQARVIEGPRPIICTDPPYYDNIGYAELSDFFYVWLRAWLGDVWPHLFSTILTPKSAELVASRHRFKEKDEANAFFEGGLRDTFSNLHEMSNPAYPMTVFYAFKQSESTSSGGTASTGWETMLEGLLDAGWRVTSTWPMRTERISRSVAIGTNALASSVVLSCRPQDADAPLGSRQDFVRELRRELPVALRLLQAGNVAPVDLAQAAIGPGMAVFSGFRRVIEADGRPMKVRSALELINQVLDETLSEQEGDFDLDTRWALAWYAQFGLEAGEYGSAETLARAKNTAVAAIAEAGIIESKAGKVRLLPREALAPDWDPLSDSRTPVWEVTQHLIRRLEADGEEAAAALANRVGGLGETAKELAYRLYAICEKRGWGDEAIAYNSLVIAWPQVARLAEQARSEPATAQSALDV